MKNLFIFDMDGTLLPYTTSSLQIAQATGHCDVLEALEKQYLQKQITNDLFARTIYELWQDLSHEIVKEVFDNSPKLKNIPEVLARIADCGGTSCLITASPSFFADHFFEYGFDHIMASKPFTLIERKFTPENILYSKDKPLIARRLCEELALDFNSSVAFGDSLSDIHLFQALHHTIAVNGDHHIQEYAKSHYTGLDLMEAFDLATAHMQQPVEAF